jgi:ABC-type antimicrobial peptide transport system permease subunit
MSYAVTQRTQEFGIRIALGAERLDVLRMVLLDSLPIIAVGAAFGTAAALAMTRFVSSLLFGITPSDPVAVLTAILVLATVVLTAATVPAFRAARVDPMVVLRYE